MKSSKSLTEKQKQSLNKAVLGYGKFKEFYELCGVSAMSLWKAKKGRELSPETLKKITSNL